MILLPTASDRVYPKKTAFFLGRFQPVPHNGHVAMVKEILEQYEHIIIGIGSAQYKRKQGYFSSWHERKTIWEHILIRMRIESDRYTIVPIDDIDDNDAYVEHVNKIVPTFDHIVTGNELVSQLYHDAGIRVMLIQKRYFDLSNAKVRELLSQGKSVSDLLPQESNIFIEAHRAEFNKIYT